MEVPQLRRHLLAAVQYGNLARAAEESDISQPGLSRSIKSLETRLGVKLLVRGPAGVEPTEFGLGLISRARIILNEVSRAQQLLKKSEAGELGEVTIGATHNYARIVLPDVVAKFAGARQQVKIHVIIASFPELIDGIKVGRMDFALALLAPIDHGDELRVEELADRTFEGPTGGADSRSSTAQRLDGYRCPPPTRADQPASRVDPAGSTPDTSLFPGLSIAEYDRPCPAAASAAQVCLWIRYRRPLASASQKQTLPRRRTRRHRQVLALGHVHGSFPMRQDARDALRLLEARDHA